MTTQSNFLAYGRELLCAALEPEIRAQVVAEFAAQLEEAGFWKRFWLRRKIEREIRLRIAELAPSDALY